MKKVSSCTCYLALRLLSFTPLVIVVNYLFFLLSYLLVFSCVSFDLLVFPVTCLNLLLPACISCYPVVFSLTCLYFLFHACISCYLLVFLVTSLYFLLPACISCNQLVFSVTCLYFLVCQMLAELTHSCFRFEKQSNLFD